MAQLNSNTTNFVDLYAHISREEYNKLIETQGKAEADASNDVFPKGVDRSMYKFKGRCKQYTWLGGPMGSKKSIELIAELLRQSRGPKSSIKPVLAIKPTLDTRKLDSSGTYGSGLNNSTEIIWQPDNPLYPLIFDKKGYIESRIGVKYPCVLIPDDELLDFLATPEILETIEVFGFDEMQFFKFKREAVAFLLNHGKVVITAGLDADYRGEPFLAYTDLVAWATEVKKFKANCANCGDLDAAHSQRLTLDNKLVVVGADNYEARCSACFEPGV